MRFSQKIQNFSKQAQDDISIVNNLEMEEENSTIKSFDETGGINEKSYFKSAPALMDTSKNNIEKDVNYGEVLFNNDLIMGRDAPKVYI